MTKRNNMRENQDEKEEDERKRETRTKRQWKEEACRLEQNGSDKDDTK